MPPRAVSVVVGVAIVISTIQIPITDASAMVIRTFANCTAMHRVYKHGVGRRYAHDHTSGTPVTNFYRNNALYYANRKSDRDGDGIACEAR